MSIDDQGLISGWRYNPTLKLKTPLTFVQRHGAISLRDRAPCNRLFEFTPPFFGHGNTRHRVGPVRICSEEQ